MSASGLRHPPLQAWHVDAAHQYAELGDLALESGETIREFRQTYVTHGSLDADRANVVVLLPAITATHHRLDFLVGPGKALDPARWHVIAVDAIGNGVATSPSNSRLQPGMGFPRFTVRDMVAAQHRLLQEYLGLRDVHAVIGASMGGMQALQWGVSHPGFARALVAMTPMARTTAWSRAVNEATRACLMADPAWTGAGFSARPDRGWKAWVAVQQVLAARTPQAVDHDFPEPSALVPWLADRQQAWAAGGFDAHDFLYQSWAYDGHDVGAGPAFRGDWRRALRSITARTLVMTPPLDLYNPSAAGIEAASLIPGARHVTIPSLEGHQAANVSKPADVAFVNREVARFLEGAGAP
jgi:homoserine O-acetyltransferase